MQVVARIQGHPLRRHLHRPLAKSLGVPLVEISLHESIPPNPYLGYRKCLRNIPECSHLLVIQEDAQVCRNFGRVLPKVACEHPVVLFLSRLPGRISTQALRAAKRREVYVDAQLRINEFCPAVAILWPKRKAEEFLAWTHENPHRLAHKAPRSDDGVLGRWASLTHQTIRFTVPSLVEHPDLEPSLIGRKAAWGKDSGRVALLLAEDALAYEW